MIENMSLPPGSVGGGIINMIPQQLQPIWYPPITVKWILTGFIVFVGAVAPRIPDQYRTYVAHPIGFFFIALLSLVMYQWGFPPMSFAMIFFLLSIWAAHQARETEGFLNATSTVDWVNNSKRWYVEKVLQERPLGIQDKEVATYPVFS
jgi:hypothetical protein